MIATPGPNPCRRMTPPRRPSTSPTAGFPAYVGHTRISSPGRASEYAGAACIREGRVSAGPPEAGTAKRRGDQTRPRVRDLADAHRANSHRQGKGAGDGHASAGSSGPGGHHRTGSAEKRKDAAAGAGSSGRRIGAGPAPQSGRDVRARDARARRRRAPSRRAARAARPALLRVPPRWRPAVLAGTRDGYTKRNRFYVQIAEALGWGLLTTEGERWQRQRRLIQPLFTGSRSRATRT